jgi:SPFH domain/Band 7 family protein
MTAVLADASTRRMDIPQLLFREETEMTPGWFVLIFLVPLAIAALIVWRLSFSNSFTVKPNNIERLVVQNAISGDARVLGPGTHFLGPEWKILETVLLNREPVNIGGAQAEEVKSSDGIRLQIEYRFDMVTGRPFDPTTGKLTVAVDDLHAVQDKFVLLAVTRIKFNERRERILEIIRASLEDELGRFQADQLMIPGEVPGGFVSMVDPISPQGQMREVRSSAQLYNFLESYVEDNTNRHLTHVGINIVDFHITNLRFKDDRLQEALEIKKRMQKLADAADLVMDRQQQKSREDPLRYREALAAGTDQYGDVTKAQAGRDVAKSFGRGISDVGEGLKEIGRGLGKRK